MISKFPKANTCAHFEELVSRTNTGVPRAFQGTVVKTILDIQSNKNQTLTNHQNGCWYHLNSNFNAKLVLCSPCVQSFAFAWQESRSKSKIRQAEYMFSSTSQNTDPLLNVWEHKCCNLQHLWPSRDVWSPKYCNLQHIQSSLNVRGPKCYNLQDVWSSLNLWDPKFCNLQHIRRWDPKCCNLQNIWSSLMWETPSVVIYNPCFTPSSHPIPHQMPSSPTAARTKSCTPGRDHARS